jgi:hypothetical protein
MASRRVSLPALLAPLGVVCDCVPGDGADAAIAS